MNRAIKIFNKKRKIFDDSSDEESEIQYNKIIKRRNETENTVRKDNLSNLLILPNSSMNILSCPQEMLASVLKYITFQTVTRIRKLNKHMNYVAKKYKMNLPKVKSAGIRSESTNNEIIINQNVIVVFYDMKLIWDNHGFYNGFTRFKPNLQYNSSTIQQSFEDILKKIRPCNYEFENLEIGQTIVNLLQKQRSTKKMSLYIYNCNFTIPVDQLASMMAKYTNSSMIINPGFSQNQIMNEPLGTDAALVPLIPYTSITYTLREGRPAFTDALLRAARQYMPDVFEVGYFCPFSVSEIKKALVRLIECYEQKEKMRKTYADEVMKRTSWDLGHLQMDSIEQLEWATAELLSVPNTKATYLGKTRLYIWYNCDKQSFSDIFQIHLELRRS